MSYLGTPFAGFQAQAGVKTVESAFHDAFAKLVPEPPDITGAGRTDAGVHAKGQVLSCRFASRFEANTLPKALSHFLNPEIIVYRADEMHADFDAQRQSIGKRYVYRLALSAREQPFKHLYTWRIKKPLDIQAMRLAAQCLVGEHDYESFRSSQCGAAHARRYIWQISINDDWEIDIRGNAFCHNMVRIIVGSLVEVGLGKLKALDMQSILDAKDRTRAGRTAPPHGLTLEEVYYPDDLTQAGIPEGAKFPRYPVSLETWPC
ncbi:MAG: tRNA pseudouridine(38-40) synthase TruA [Myxococcota bacterium]